MAGNQWTLEKAVALCAKIEAICPAFGCHVALTGGTLYKEGARKDADILFYKIRQIDEIQYFSLYEALEDIGIEMLARKGWVQKAKYQGSPLDLFFPEDNPASSRQVATGDY